MKATCWWEAIKIFKLSKRKVLAIVVIALEAPRVHDEFLFLLLPHRLGTVDVVFATSWAETFAELAQLTVVLAKVLIALEGPPVPHELLFLLLPLLLGTVAVDFAADSKTWWAETFAELAQLTVQDVVGRNFR